MKIPRHVFADAEGRKTEVTTVAGELAGKAPPAPPPNSWASRSDTDVAIWTLRLDEGAYGAAIRQEIHERSGRDVSINAVYTTLDRLEGKGLLRSWVG